MLRQMSRKLLLAIVATATVMTGLVGLNAEPAAAAPQVFAFPAKVDIDGRNSPRAEDRSVKDAYLAGQSVNIRCQDFGESVKDSGIWNFTDRNLWVPDAYVLTGSDGFKPGIPRCDAIGIKGALPEVRNSFPAKVDIDGRGSLNFEDRVHKNAFRKGAPVEILCQEIGPAVNGNRVWNRTMNNLWVPDAYVKTGVDGFLPGIPRCSVFSRMLDDMNGVLEAGEGPYKAKVDVDGRNSPRLSDRAKTNAYYKDQPVYIRCQDNGEAVNGNSVWNFTSKGYWIPDAYVTTGVDGFLPNLDRCTAQGVGEEADTRGNFGPYPAKVDIDGRATPATEDRVKVDAYYRGNSVYLTCQENGETVNGNSVWGFTTTGVWVPDAYITTGVDGFLEGLPRCTDVGVLPKGGNGQFGPFKAKVALDGRTSINPEVRGTVDLYKANGDVYIKCQDLGPMVKGSSIWDFTTDNEWVPDTYLKTGTDDWLSHVPRCSGIGIGGGGTRDIPVGEASGVRAKIVAAAKSKVNLAETGDNCNPFGASGTRCGAPWCTMFATWSWNQAGISYYTDASWQLESWGRRNGLLRSKATAKPGDIVIYANRRDGGGFRHTGVIESVRSDGRITTVEGNYGNKVTRVAGIDTNRPTPPHTYKHVIAIVAPLHDLGTPYQKPLTPEEELEANRLDPIAPAALIDADLGPAIEAAQRRGNTVRVDELIHEYLRRENDAYYGEGAGAFRHFESLAPTPAVNGRAMVDRDVAAKIVQNVVDGQHPWKAAEGKGGSAWFVTEGNPYTGTDTPKPGALPKDVPIEVELRPKKNRTVYDAKRDLEPRKAANYPQAFIDTYEKARDRYRLTRKVEDVPSNLNKDVRHWHQRRSNKVAEDRMWEALGRETATSRSKMTEVIFKASELSKKGDGRYLVVADDARIVLRGGLYPLLSTMERLKYAEGLDPDARQAAEAVAKRSGSSSTVQKAFRWGGRIFIVVGVGVDAYRVVVAEDKLEVVIESAAGWAAATAAGGAAGAYFTPALGAGPWGWAGYGVGVLGAGAIGYWAGSETARRIYRMIVHDEAFFHR